MSDTRKGKAKLRPRARIIRTIGSDLISNEVIALVELIKNSYDADASKVRVVFQEPLQASHGGIIIDDDGFGMSLETVLNSWFEPATTTKVKNTRSPSGRRRVTGEKGIGRFAAARLARAIELTSVSKETNRLVRVRLDWGVFDDESLYLDEVDCRWEEMPVPKGRKHGTQIHLTGLNDTWGSKSFERLRGELSRLVSPTALQREFEITLELPDKYNEFAGIVTPPPILGRPHYKLSGSINASGKFKAKYYGPDVKAPIEISDTVFRTDVKAPECGPFQFEFRVWDRDKDGLDPLVRELGSPIKKLREDLDSACGVSIYRDDFRILLSDNDWLRLDIRRVQNPTMRLSNNQIVGAIFISADTNFGLKDQTNREGIVSSPGFQDFKRVIIELISKIEIKRDSIRRPAQKESNTGLFQQLSIEPIRAYLFKRYPQDVELKKFFNEQSKTFQQGINEVQQTLARYRRLATLGQLIDMVLHEGRTPVAAISGEVALCRRQIEKNKGKVDDQSMLNRFRTIDNQTVFLSELFRRLAPFSGRKRGRPAKILLEEILKDCFLLNRKRIKELEVKVTQPTSQTSVTVDQAEMQQIFVNILDNSLYWLEKVPADQREIIVQITRNVDRLDITFSDSGPGVPEEIQDKIFDPYFSAKPDGVGLGLTIAGETAAEYDGSLELVSGGPLSGATFRVTLRKRIGGIQDV